MGGTPSIPVKGGQSVKPFFLKRIVEAIQIVQDAEKEQDEDNPAKTHTDAEPISAAETSTD